MTDKFGRSISGSSATTKRGVTKSYVRANYIESFPVETFLRTTTRKTVCFHLSLSLLNETSKRQPSRMKVVEDVKLSFHCNRILVSWWTLLSTLSSIKVFLHPLSKLWNEAKQLQHFSNEIVEDPHSIATKTSCPGKSFCQKLPEKHSASICRQVCWMKHQSGNFLEWRLLRT